MQRGEAGESGGGFDAVLAQIELGEGEADGRREIRKEEVNTTMYDVPIE